MSFDDDYSEDTVTCADCGATLWASSDTDFPLDEERVLCWHCAVRRGGRYDLERECWRPPPNVLDLYRPIW